MSCVCSVQHNKSDAVHVRAGPLPKVMPVSLEILNLSGGDSRCGGTPHAFTGGIPVEWSSMTNLKELKMVACGLDGQCFNRKSAIGGIKSSVRANASCVVRRVFTRERACSPLFQRSTRVLCLVAGRIPPEIKECTALQSLDLSCNALEGPCAHCLQELR